MNRTPSTEATPVVSDKTSLFNGVPGKGEPLPPTEEVEVVTMARAPVVEDPVPSLVLMATAPAA